MIWWKRYQIRRDVSSKAYFQFSINVINERLITVKKGRKHKVKGEV